MTDEQLQLEIDVRPLGKPGYRIALPGAFTLESDQLDRAMERCNKFFGDPTKNIGGPRLPEVKPK